MSRFNNPAALLKPERSRRAAIQPAVTPATKLPSVGASVLPPPVSNPAAQGADDGVLGRIGFAAALAYVFIRFGLLNDAITTILGFNPHLVYFIAPVAMLAVLFTRGLFRAVQYKPGILFCAFMGWLLIATPFSVWRGGSFQTLFTAFEADFSMFFMIVGLTTTWRRFRLMLFAIAAGGVCDFLLCLRYPGSVEGRFALGFGTLSNPNDLATQFLFALPMCVFAFLVSKRVSLAKFILPPTIVGILIFVLRTGSRAALLTLIGISLYLVFRGSVQLKIAALVAVAVLGTIAVLILPADVKWRYLSLFSSSSSMADVDATRAQEATGSATARQQLLENSLSETIHHPLFGVGPGEFAVAEADVAKTLGRRAGWQVTHNSYTQVSAEAGIPAFLFFAGALFGSMKLLYTVYKRSSAQARLHYLAVPTLCLLVSTIALSINIFFSALAYGYYVPAITALAMAAASIANLDSRGYPARKPS